MKIKDKYFLDIFRYFPNSIGSFASIRKFLVFLEIRRWRVRKWAPCVYIFNETNKISPFDLIIRYFDLLNWKNHRTGRLQSAYYGSCYAQSSNTLPQRNELLEKSSLCFSSCPFNSNKIALHVMNDQKSDFHP